MAASNDKPKVLFLIPTFNSGGIEQYLLRFLREKHNLLSATVLSRNTIKGELYKSYQQLGIDLKLMPLGYLNFVRLFRLYHLIRQEKFDVVCDFNGNFAGMTMLVASLCGVKSRITWYRQAKDHFVSNIFKVLYNKLANRLVFYLSTKILFNSYTAMAFFFSGERRHKKFRVIYNGIQPEILEPTLSKKEIRESLNIPHDKYVIGHIGRLDQVKNHDVIIKLAQFFNKKVHSFHFVCCGSNVPDLASQIIENDVKSTFTLVNYRNDINNVLNAFDLFYFPSITEGQPNALLEAIIFGLPFVASNIDAIKECVPEAAYNQLVAPHDYTSAAHLIQEIAVSQKGTYVYKEWASNAYDAEKRFYEFLQELVITQ